MTDPQKVHVQRVFVCDYLCDISDYEGMASTLDEIRALELGLDEPSMFADMLEQVSVDVTILTVPPGTSE